MKKIVFATTNEGKIREAKEILQIEVVPTSLEIDEVQSLDPEEVTLKKAKAYFSKIKKPVLVEDVSFVFTALRKLPGPYIDGFSKSLGNTGMCKLVKNYKNKKAVAITTLAYVDAKGKVNLFVGKVEGKIVTTPRGKNGFGWDSIFVPKGSSKTFAQMNAEEKNNYSMRKKALVKFKKWLLTQ